jgi:protease-4
MTDPVPPSWEREVLEKVALKALEEQRRARQWSALFKLLWFGFALLAFATAMGWLGRPEADGLPMGTRHTALVEIEGIIGAESRASAERVIKGLNKAFRDPGTQAVIVRINSPGGSPVQAGYINDEIRRLRAKYPNIPVYAVVQDLCASGGYYVAVAADRIYVDKASIVGSIGVIMGGFGFPGALDKLGIERRVYTAGENKDFLDPFRPENPEHVAHAKQLAEQIHAQFISVVKQGRGTRLKEFPGLFSGLVWTGEKSIELGLADALGSAESVARDVVKAEKIVDYTPDESVFERFSKRLGTEAGASFARALTQGAGVSLMQAR